jgi:predicted RNA-binding protein with TRAM domain
VLLMGERTFCVICDEDVEIVKIRGFVILVNNSNEEERVKIRIKQVSRNHAVADVISS